MTVQEYMVPMRDGPALYTFCILPDGKGPFPVIFSRSPYDDPKYDPAACPDSFRAETDAGYAVVHQSCRGTARSEGFFVPFMTEREDGLDTLDWIRAQPFYNGEIYVQGGSYCSYVHLAYIGTRQKDVKGAFLYVMPTDMKKGMTVGGVLKQDIMTPWYIQQYHKNQEDVRAIVGHYPAMTLARPLHAALDPYYEGGNPVYSSLLREADGIWEKHPGPADSLNAMSDLAVPVLITEGWYDIYIGDGSHMWEELPEDVRNQSALLVGPWPHSCRTTADWPLSFPNGDSPAGLMVSWFDHIRTGSEPVFVKPGQVRYYVIGENEWHFAPRMPEGEASLALCLNAGRALDGTPSEEEEIGWLYDPEKPAAFTGGANAFCTVPQGLRPQPAPNAQADVVSFVGRPLAEDIDVVGRVRFDLTVKSDAEDTAFFARLLVLRDGNWLPVQESITTLRLENPAYVPGAEAVVSMTCDPTAWRFFKGETLRVDVASACWPIYAAHGNTALPLYEQTETRPAVNAVVAGRSRVVLPTPR